MRRLLLRLDANHEVGLGHAVRVGAVLAELKTPVRPIVAGRGDALATLFAGAEQYPLPDDDTDTHWAELAALRPHAVLVDLPRAPARPWTELRRFGVPLIVIDDEGSVLDADLVINGTALGDHALYRELPAGARKLLGPEYCLLRPAFAAHRWCPAPDRSLSVVVGSGEIAHTWAFALAGGGLADLGLDRCTLTVGLSFPCAPGLRRLAATHGITVCQGRDAASLAAQFAGHAVSLVTGGMVAYEALATGAPVVAYPQVDNLVAEMRWFAERGCLTDLGPDGGRDLARVRAAVARLADNPTIAMAQARAGHAVVDGLGAPRAATAIDEMLGKH